MDKMTELLKERLGLISKAAEKVAESIPDTDIQTLMEARGICEQVTALLTTIDTAPAPSPSSAEIAHQIMMTATLGKDGKTEWTLEGQAKAAALIDQCRTVLSDDDIATIKMAVSLLDEFDYVADEDSCGMSFFKARTSEDGFFIIKNRLGKFLTTHDYTVKE